jgi:hypothetical protein
VNTIRHLIMPTDSRGRAKGGVRTTAIIALIAVCTTAVAATSEMAATGRTQAEACTKAHNIVVKWLRENEWKFTAVRQSVSEGQCHCNGDDRTGYYCAIPISSS